MTTSDLTCLFDRESIAARVQDVARDIDRHYARIEEPVVAVCVLKGACIFFADLIRHMQTPTQLDFVRLASYGQETTRGPRVHFWKDVEIPLQGKHVLVVEDIVDTGHTLAYLKQVFLARQPKSVSICSLIHKTGRREVELFIDFYGFCLEKGFVVGYGLDCAEAYRQLDAIYEVSQD